MFIGLTASPKVFMFITYQTTLFAFVGYILMTVWVPLIDHPWYYIDWFRVVLIGLTAAILGTGLYLSIVSCFTTKALTETQIGQWTFAGWMPEGEWGKNIRNKPYGVFTGLPAWMVKIIALDGTSKTISRKITIQIGIYGSTPPRNFAAVVELIFKVRIYDTYVSLNNPHTDDDLVNLVIKALTGYLTEPGNKYTEVGTKLRSEIKEMQTRVITAITESKTLFGKEMTDFKLVDIEKPEKIIAQEIASAAAITARQAKEAEEKLDNDSHNQQIDDIIERAAAKGEKLTYTQAAEQLGIRQSLISRTSFTGNVKPVVFTDARGGKKDKNSST
jgi:hypothetical protein